MKAKVLCILNHKGGVGKTTTTINLGGALQQKGYKVLLIDLDGQANLTESLGLSAELPQTIYGAMKGEYPLPIYQHKDGMSIVPSCLDLSAVETELINEAGRELILAHLIKGKVRLYPDRLPTVIVIADFKCADRFGSAYHPCTGAISRHARYGQADAGRKQGTAAS